MAIDPPIRSIVALRQIHMLGRLAEERLESISQECHWQVLAARRFITHRSEHQREVHFIVSGAARVTSYSPTGRQVSFRDVYRGECVGILAAIDGEPRSADVIATESCVLASLSADQFNRILATEPEFARAVMAHLSMLVRQMTMRLIDLSTLDVSTRVHAELLRRALMAAPAGQDVARLDPFPSHEAFASLVSTGREQVTRELNRLIRVGVLEKDRFALVVTSIAELARLAHAAEPGPVDLNTIRAPRPGA